jgi:hypothetical protein
MTTTHRGPEVVRGYHGRSDGSAADGRRSATPAPAPAPQQPEPQRQPQGPPSPWRQRIPGPQLPGLVTGVLLLAGCWLMLAPAVLDYADAGGGFGARWNDLLVGLVLAVVAIGRLTGVARLGLASAVPLVLGLWLMIAPLVLAYGLGPNSSRATVNDMIVGVLVAGIAAVGYVSGRMAVATRI